MLKGGIMHMKRILSIFLVLALTFSLVSAFTPDPYMRYMPSFNVKMTMGGETTVLNGEPMGSVLLTRGNMVSVILRGLEPDSYYSLRHGSDCIDFAEKTNMHGNLRTEKVEWDYTDLYEMRDVPLGGDIPTLIEGEAEDFELFNFKCSASTGEMVLKGVEPKNSIRVVYP